MSKKWSLRLCSRCGVESHMHAPRRVCVQCRTAEEKSPEKALQRNAQQAVAKAVRAGRLIRLPCEACALKGSAQDTPSQGHHEDYSKALDVNWLCAMHHRWAHRYGLEKMLAFARPKVAA